MQLPVEITIIHKKSSKVTGVKSVTEYFLTAESTAHATSLLAGCQNLRSIEKRADRVVENGKVVKDKYTKIVQPVSAVVVPKAS